MKGFVKSMLASLAAMFVGWAGVQFYTKLGAPFSLTAGVTAGAVVFVCYRHFVDFPKANWSWILFASFVLIILAPVIFLCYLWDTYADKQEVPASLAILSCLTPFLATALWFVCFVGSSGGFRFMLIRWRTKRRGLDRRISEALCTVSKAMQEIEFVTQHLFHRGQCVDPKKLEEIMIPPHNRPTIRLELDVEDIFKKHIGKTSFSGQTKILSDGRVIQGHPHPDVLWILDPIDGGRHCRREIPLFASCAAFLLKNDKGRFETKASMVYVHVTQEVFFAVKGEGAYLNTWKNEIGVSENPFDKALAYVEFPNIDAQEADEKAFEEERKLVNEIFAGINRVRGGGLGSLGLAYVAKGAFDAYVGTPGTTLVNDVAAGILLVEQAKGKVLKCAAMRIPKEDQPSGVRVIAANPGVFAALRETIHKYPSAFPNPEEEILYDHTVFDERG